MIGVDVMNFSSPLLLLATLTCWTGICSAQSPAQRFHWDCRSSDELSWRESISRSKTLSATERAGLIEALTSRPRPLRNKSKVESEKEPASIEQTRIRAVDLSGDGIREFAAQSSGDQSCSPTGNCDFWILRQDRDKYSVMPTVTNGFHDIVLGQHGSATETGLTLYRFDGSRYRRVSCYDASWTALGKDGEYHDLKEPRVTPSICTMR